MEFRYIEMNRILIIDDEKENLEALTRLLRRDYDVKTTVSPFEGLKWIQTEIFHVIVCDQRMAEMTGVEFFEKAEVAAPLATRILLTGYTDIESVIEAINRGHIYRYIAKPWDPEEFKIVMRQGAEASELRREVEQLDRAKARFMSLVSHELNTPLSVLKAHIELLKQDGLSPADRKVTVGHLGLAADRFSEIVDEILAFTALENRPSSEREEIDFARVLQERARGAKVRVSTQGKCLFLGAADQWDRVAHRLIHVARSMGKGAPANQILVARHGNMLHVEVILPGVEVEEAALEPLSYSGDPLKHHRNLGLDLAFARAVAELHNGGLKMHVEGGGTRLTLTVPSPL